MTAARLEACMLDATDPVLSNRKRDSPVNGAADVARRDRRIRECLEKVDESNARTLAWIAGRAAA